MTYWTHLHNIRYEASKRLDALAFLVARNLPRRVRVWAVVNAAVIATEPAMRSGGYCGPDGLTYKDLHDAAAR